MNESREGPHKGTKVTSDVRGITIKGLQSSGPYGRNSEEARASQAKNGLASNVYSRVAHAPLMHLIESSSSPLHATVQLNLLPAWHS